MNNTFKSITGLLFLCLLPDVYASVNCTNENTAVPASTPTADFSLHANGTATHNTTGLMWMRCSLGQTWNSGSCTGSAAAYTWADALAQGGTSFAGYSDWRLPNINELGSIVEERCYNPTINLAVFPNTSAGWFWSSSPSAYDSVNAWLIDIDRGGGLFYGKNDNFQVRLVRSGSSSAGQSTIVVGLGPPHDGWRTSPVGMVMELGDGPDSIGYLPTGDDHDLLFDIAGPVDFNGVTFDFDYEVDATFAASNARLEFILEVNSEWGFPLWWQSCYLDTSVGLHERQCTMAPPPHLPDMNMSIGEGEAAHFGLRAKTNEGNVPAGLVRITRLTLSLIANP